MKEPAAQSANMMTNGEIKYFFISLLNKTSYEDDPPRLV
jgi:hypothetical protein